MSIRMVLIAPFNVINLAVGLSHIRFHDDLRGTILGMAPGLLIITALGHRLAQVLADPSAGEIALLALIISLWLGACAGLQVAVSSVRCTSHVARSSPMPARSRARAVLGKTMLRRASDRFPLVAISMSRLTADRRACELLVKLGLERWLPGFDRHQALERPSER